MRYLEHFTRASVPVKLLSCILSAAGILLFLLLIPSVFIGVINTGSYAGFAISIALAATGAAAPICIRSKRKAVKNIYRVILGVFAALTVYAATLSALMLSAIVDAPEQNSTSAVMVLGCQVRRDGPSLMLTKRLEAAYGYLSENPSAICIVSGGKGDNEPVSEAQAMHDWLAAKSIDSSRILIEDKSSSTEENLLFSKEVLLENGRGSDVILVTDGFHLYRASCMAQQQGYSVIGTIAADTPFFLLPVYWIREWMAISYMLVFGV